MDPIKLLAAAEFEKVFKKCILRYAKKYGGDQTNVFVQLGLDRDGDVIYNTLMYVPGEIGYKSLIPVPEGYKPVVKEYITILNVLDARFFHHKGYEHIAPPYIKSSLERLAQELNVRPQQVSVFICTNTVDLYLILCIVEDNEIKHMVRVIGDIAELF